MTTTEALRLQLDNLQREKQELEVRNLKLSGNPSKEVLREVEKERDHWKEECKRITVENEQLKLLYEELLQQFSGVQTNLNGLAQVSKILLNYRRWKKN